MAGLNLDKLNDDAPKGFKPASSVFADARTPQAPSEPKVFDYGRVANLPWGTPPVKRPPAQADASADVVSSRSTHGVATAPTAFTIANATIQAGSVTVNSQAAGGANPASRTPVSPVANPPQSSPSNANGVAASASPASPTVDKPANAATGASTFAQNAVTAAQATTKLAYDPSDALKAAVTQVAGFASMLPGAGGAIGGIASASVKVTEAFGQAADAFIRRGQELAQYSPALTQANAVADIRSMTGDISEANRLGPDMARLTDDSSKLWNDLRELMLPIKDFAVGTMADFVSIAKDFMHFAKGVFKPIAEGITSILKVLRDIVLFVPKLFGQLASKIGDLPSGIADEEERRRLANQPLDDFMMALDGMELPSFSQPNPLGDRDASAMNIPAFMGVR